MECFEGDSASDVNVLGCICCHDIVAGELNLV